MNRHVSWLITAIVVVICIASLAGSAQSAAIVVYLDESGGLSGYNHPAANDPVSALNLLASPPSDVEAGMKLFSALPPGTKLIGTHKDGDAIVVNFSSELIGAELSESRMESIFLQVRNTLWQFGITGEIRVLADGRFLSEYVKPAPDVSPSQQALAEGKERGIAAAGLSGKKITLSPGHGKRWNGSTWATARPVYCSPLNEEDYHNLENAQYLEAYLLQDGMTVKMMRCTDKSYGASPWAGGEQWWRMGACYWLQHIGYPGSVYGPGGTNLGAGGSDDTNEIQSRPLSSDYDNSDIYVSLHTNGLAGDCSGTGCPTGCCTYYDASSEHAAWGTVSRNLGTAINNNIIDVIRTQYVDAGWRDRGVINSNGAYGEIRIPDRAAVLIELAFHDSCDTDAMKLRDNFFRSAAMWGVYKGICEYFGTTPSYDFYSCELVSHDIPTAMSVGETRTVHVTLRNTGVLWNNAKGFRLGAVDDSDPFSAVTRQTISGEVGPTKTYTFTFNLKAPNAVGTFVTDWRMVRDGFTWFGPTITQAIEVTGTPDYEPPTAPTGLTGTSDYSYRMNLSWNPATDNVAVESYNIYRDGVKIGSSTTTSYTDNTCTAATTYTYEVTACDTVPNESAKSAPAILTTQDADSVAPTVPTNLRTTAVTASSVALAWNASTDYYGVTGYNIYRNGAKIGSSATTSYTDNTCASATTYTYEVTAYDAMLNESEKSAPVVVTTPVPYTTIWEEGFDGPASFNNWTVVSGYVYDTAVSRGAIPGAGSAYIAGTAASQMWRQAASRPFAECRVSAYYYDLKGGYKSGVCGNSQRESLRLTADGTVSMFLEHGIYSAPSYATYNYRTVGAGGIGWTAIGNRNPSTNCNPAWVYFETTVTPGNPGASPVGTVTFKAVDGGGTVSKTPNLQTDFFNNGVGRVYLGLNLTSTHGGRRWDDIKLEATRPGAPIIGAATANSASQITWTWTRADNNVFGFNIADADGTIVSPQWPASGWRNRAATSWAETGLAANTQYTRKVLAWNGSLDSEFSATVSKYTLSLPPTTARVTCDKPAGSWSSSPGFTFTAVGGFGAGRVEYYRCAWDQSPTHTWTGDEQVWDEETIVRSAESPGQWYFHVQGFNAEGVPNGTLTLGPYGYDTTAPSAPVVTDEGMYTVSDTTLTANWTATDAESGIAEYQYAIGTTIGGNDVVDWTLTTEASVTRSGLSLSVGSTYYFSVKAKNSAGIWSEAGNSDGITVGAPNGTIAFVKSLADGQIVGLTSKVLTANFGLSSYIEESDGSSGIRIDGVSPAPGNLVSVAGILGTSSDGERYIGNATCQSGGPAAMPFIPLLRTSDLGGAALNSRTPGVTGATGVNNIGLLVSIAGKITHVDTDFVYIDDGVGLEDGSGFIGVRVDKTGLTKVFTQGKHAVVTGISSIKQLGSNYIRVLRAGSDDDVVIYP